MEPSVESLYFPALSQGISKEWAEGNFADLEVIVEGQNFKCHRIILASMSQYFSTMFTSGFKESTEKSVEIKGMKGDAFHLVLEYIYTGRNIVSIDNVVHVLQSASMLQIKTLQDLCKSFLRKNLSVENCIGFWRLTFLYSLGDLQALMWTFLVKKFPVIVNCMEFLSLHEGELLKIIDDQDLNTPSEEFVCEMVMKWYTANKNISSEVLVAIFEHLKFQLMDEKYVRNLMTKFPELNQIGPIKAMVEQRLLAELNADMLDSSYRKEEIFCMVGTRSRMPDPSKTEVQCYSYQDKKQFHLAPLPIEPGPCFAVCTLNNDIYISGGYNQQHLVLHFSSKLNKWDQYNCIHDARWGHGMVAIDGYIYLIGGMSKTMETLSTIERYNPNTNTCEKVGNLKQAISSMTVAVKGSKIYTFGGKQNDRNASLLIQTYDVIEGESKVIGELPATCAGGVGKTVTFGEDIFIIFREGNIAQFNETEGTEVVGFSQRFEHFGTVMKENKILIIGCASSNFTSYSFDPVFKKIVDIPSEFKAPMCNFHLLRVILSKKYLVN
ncbi:kelch-like protein 6 [Mytilus trossulus]|uniref:kelch-like protein 6 n=1 Tax=Mytilus trossulus TaxID=6551 RepID=UPI003006A098